MIWLLLTLRFALELCLLVALAYVGFHVVDTGALRYVLMVAFPIGASLIWGAFVAPKAKIEVPVAVRFAIELTLFAAAVTGLYVVGQTKLAIALGAGELIIGTLNLLYGGEARAAAKTSGR